MHRSADTSPDAHDIMLAKFEAMSIAERATLAAELSDQCTMLAVAGIRALHPDLPDEDLRWHLAMRRYGQSLADEVYGPRTAK